jgi:CTP synthase
MGLILVYHETPLPALYCAVAVAVAAARDCGFMHAAARFDTSRHADAEQHVVATGGLVASGLWWFERLSGKQAPAVASTPAILDAARLTDVVVPIHPAFLADVDLPATLLSGAQAQGIRVETVTVLDEGDRFLDAGTQRVLAWRDRFGRICMQKPPEPAVPSMTIGLVGDENDHLGVYPAALASLADAADSLSMTIEVRFIDPVAFGRVEDPGALAALSGILLPGGADMKNVPGQIAVAAHTLERAVPTVGLCLGMQTMATAVAWKSLGRLNANLAEADPSAVIKTFVAMNGEKDADGRSLPTHRTGDAAVQTVPGTYLHSLLAAGAPVRFNHRFRLNPDIAANLETSGLRISARGLSGAVVDAIEVPDHPFFMGMQGHPELSSRPGAPHPLLVAFLEAAALYRQAAS